MRGALGMGVTWALGWAVGGILIGVSSLLLPFLPWDAFFRFFDAPLPMLAVPGFIGGAIFSVVLGIAGRRHRFDELSVPRFAAWGALGGFLLSLVPLAFVATGLGSTEGSDTSIWTATAIMMGPLVILSSLSAAGSLWIARRAQGRASRDDASAGLSDGRARELSERAEPSLRTRATNAEERGIPR